MWAVQRQAYVTAHKEGPTIKGTDGRCERNPFCIRGFKHGGRGGLCTIRKPGEEGGQSVAAGDAGEDVAGSGLEAMAAVGDEGSSVADAEAAGSDKDDDKKR